MIRFIKALTVFIALFGLQQGLFAQTPVKVEEGFDYRVLPIAQAVDAKGKVEVIEFFWYGCPHCYEFEPELKTWLKRQNKDVSFKKVPIAFREELMPHSLLFYALESLGKGDALNDKVMFAMHRENKRLLNENEIADWVAAQGVDRNAFLAAYRSFAVLSKARAANQLGNAYRIDGVPTVAVQGKYITSPSIAGSRAKAINVMDFLVNKVRKDGYK
ncbi:periplasmic protein disulfide isomerase I [Burkholderiaceae bacterium]